MATTTETETTDRNGDREREFSNSTTDRDRDFARLTGVVMVAWALIWTAIIAVLFLFGGTLSGIVV